MKRLRKALAALLALLMLCPAAGLGEAASPEVLPQLDDYFTERDLSGDWDATAIDILLTGDTAECRANAVSIDGGTVTILDGGTYRLSGTLADGCIVVDIKDDDKVQLVLDGADITSADGPAIRVLQADKVFITLAEGTENALANGGTFAEEGVDAVIYADEDLTFNGTGALTITSPAGDGIDGKDDVKFASGTYVITAAGRGVDANDSVRIAGGDFTIVSGGDAIRARHETNADLGYVYIWGGSFAITTGGGAANGKAHDEGMAFGGMMGGGQMGGGRMEDFNGEFNPGDMDGEMPEMPEWTGEDGEMPTPPDFTGGDGEMPEWTGEDGEMPTPPDFTGEAGEMPEMPEMPEMAEAETTSDTDTETVSAKGIKASGDIVILGGTFAFDTADDALHANRDLLLFDGSLAIASGDDGLHADGTLTVLGGVVDITQSYEGIEGEVIAIAGGDIRLVASDDGLNANAATGEKESFDAQEGVLIAISGGSLYVNAEGDGIDSNGDLAVTGGTIVVSGPQNAMNGALDYNGAATISGGTIIAAGASGMAENFSEGSEQPIFLVALTGEAGTIEVSDADGSVLLAGTVEKAFGTVVVSCPGLEVGQTYTVSCGDATAEITLTDTVTGADTGGMGGMWGQPMQ